MTAAKKKALARKSRKKDLTTRRAGPVDTYDPALADEICARVGAGERPTAICKEPGMPVWRTMHDWIVRHDEFAQKYTEARQRQAHAVVDRIHELAETLAAGKLPEGLTIQALDKAMHHLEWLAAKMAPQVYGDTRVSALVIPIQINTTLALGPGQAPAEGQTIEASYTVEARPEPITTEKKHG